MDVSQTDVLAGAPLRSSVPAGPEKKRGKGVSFILAVFLFLTLVALGERIIYDLNKNVNEYICPGYLPSYSYDYNYRGGEQKQISDDERQQQCSNYKITRLFLILALVVPVLIIGVALYVRFGMHGAGKHAPLAWSYFSFSFWMFGHLFVETAHFLIQQYTTLGIYVVLGVAVVLLTLLIWVVQRERARVA